MSTSDGLGDVLSDLLRKIDAVAEVRKAPEVDIPRRGRDTYPIAQKIVLNVVYKTCRNCGAVHACPNDRLIVPTDKGCSLDHKENVLETLSPALPREVQVFSRTIEACHLCFKETITTTFPQWK